MNNRWLILMVILSLQLILSMTLVFVYGQLKDDTTALRLPTRFVLDEPDCANKLLIALNLDNVRVLPPPNVSTTTDSVN